MGRAPIAVFFALNAESGTLEDRMRGTEHIHTPGFHYVTGLLNDVDFISVRTGAGEASARRVAKEICRIHQPRLVISAGFAGALDVLLPKNTLFFPSEFLQVNARNAEAECLTLYSRLGAEQFPPSMRKACRFGGRLLTATRVVAEVEEKKQLGATFRAQAVDMETYAVAQFCRETGLPFFAIRVISDDVETELPKDVQKLVEQKTTVSRLGTAFQMILQRPKSVRDMFHLYGTSIEASALLADALDVLSESPLLAFLTENFFPPQNAYLIE